MRGSRIFKSIRTRRFFNVPLSFSRQSTNRTETVASRDMHVRRENEPQSQHARRTSRSSIVDAAASAPSRYDTRLPLSPSHLLSNTRCVQKVAGKNKQQGANPPATRRGLYRNDVALVKQETILSRTFFHVDTVDTQYHPSPATAFRRQRRTITHRRPIITLNIALASIISRPKIIPV